jgi:hypothetical protein
MHAWVAGCGCGCGSYLPQVFIRKWPNTGMPAQFYKSMIPDLVIALCQKCNRFFHEVGAVTEGPFPPPPLYPPSPPPSTLARSSRHAQAPPLQPWCWAGAVPARSFVLKADASTSCCPSLVLCPPPVRPRAREQEDLEFEVLKLGKCPFCRCPESEVGLP